MRMSFSGGSGKPRANGEVAWRAEIAPAKAHGRWLRVNLSESARDDVRYPNIIPTRGQGAGVFVPLYQPVIVHGSSHLHKFPGTTCSVQKPTEQILTPEGSPLAKACKCWLLEAWKHTLSCVPEVGSKRFRTKYRQHLQGGALLSINGTYKAVEKWRVATRLEVGRYTQGAGEHRPDDLNSPWLVGKSLGALPGANEGIGQGAQGGAERWTWSNQLKSTWHTRN